MAWKPIDIFDVDVSTDFEEAIEQGFRIDEWGLRRKSGKAIITYDYLEGKGIFGMSIMAKIGSDSLELVNWLKENHGFICSPFVFVTKETRKFFVKGASSGLIFTAFWKNDFLLMHLDFPNIKSHNKLKNRIIKDSGKIMIYDSLKNQVQTIGRNDSIGF